MRRLTLLVLAGLLGVVSAVSAYDGPALQTYDRLDANLRVILTTPSQIAVNGQTPFTLTAFVPVDADSVGLTVDMEIRKATALGISVIAQCSYEMLPTEVGTTIAIPCHRLQSVGYLPAEGAVSVFPYVVRHSRNPVTEWVHDGFAHRVAVTMLTDDGLEQNDAFASATPLGNASTAFRTDLISGDVDYFQFTVPLGYQTTRVSLDFLHADLDLYVYNAAHEIVAVSDGYTNHEIVWFEVQQGAQYFIRVVNFSAVPAFYELVVEHATLDGVTIISGPVGAPNPVASAGWVDVAAQAYDWNGNTPTLSWSALCALLPDNGQFADPGSGITQWHAPVNATGVQQLCTITITASNVQGQTDTASYLQYVDASDDLITFSITPGGTPNPVGPDGSSLLETLAIDSQNHPLMYEWTDSCPLTENGTFVPNRYSRMPVWFAPPNPLGQLVECTLQVTVIDAFNHQKTASFTMYVPPSDQVSIVTGPTATPSTVASGGTLDLAATALDSLGHTLTFGWTDVCSTGPGGGFSNAAISNPTWTAPVNATGLAITCTLTVTASDPGGNSASKAVNVVVNSLPDNVTIVTPATSAPGSVASQGLAQLSASAADTLGHALSYAWSDTCTGPLGGGTFLPGAGVQNPQWLAPVNGTGTTHTCTLTVVATDPLGHFAASSVNVDVLSVPDAVMILTGPAGTPNPVASQGTVALLLLASDSLGHGLNYTWSVVSCTGGLGSGTFLPSNTVAQPVWQAPVNTSGAPQTCTIGVTVDDTPHGNSTSATYAQTVNDEPHAITITNGPTGTPNPVASAGFVAVTASATDPLHAALTYAWQAQCLWSAPDHGIFTPTANAASVTWQAPVNSTQQLQFCTMTVSVADGVLLPEVATYQQWVAPEDVPPPTHEILITLGPSGSPNPAPSMGSVVLNVQASDTFGHNLTYAWSVVCPDFPTTGTFSPSASHPTPIWTAPENRTGEPHACVLTVTISDGEGLSVSPTLTVTVNSVPDSVTITAGPTATPNPVASSSTTNLSVTAVDALDHLLTYAWQGQCPGLSGGGAFSPSASTAAPSWTAPLNDTGVPQVCTVSVTADDGHNHSATKSVNITVNSIPDEVTITAGPTASPNPVGSGGLVSLSVTALDSVHHLLAYQWQAVCPDFPSAGSFPSGNTAATVSWTAPVNATAATHTCTLTVTVSDGHGHTATAAKTVDVTSLGQVITVTAGPGGSLNPVVSGGTVTVFVAATDTLGRPLTHTWSATCPGLGANGTFVDVHAASTTWAAPVNLTGQAQTCTITVVVSDDLGNSVTVSYLQVVGTPPVIIVSGGSSNGGTVGSGGGIVIGVQGPDLPGQTLTYQWSSSCPALPGNGTFSSPTSATSAWTAPANQTGLPQTCVLTVTIHDGQGQVQTATFTVIVDPLCLYTVDPTSATIPAAGGNASFSVLVDPGCVWAAIPDEPWVQFNGNPQGTGNGSFVVSLSPTTEPGPRSSLVNVGGTQIEIHQLGKGYTYYLAEGATINHFFETRIALLNFGASDTATINVDFQLKDTTTVLTHTLSLGPHQRATLEVRKLAATIPALAVLDSAEFSTVVRSNIPLIVDRTMTWDDRGYGGHSETAIDAPSSVWYLAEGATIGDFELYYLIQNPNATSLDEEIEVTYLLPAPAAPIVRRYSMGPNTRRNIAVHLEPGLENVEVSAIIRTPAGKPVIVERSMYLSASDLFYAAGHESTGIKQPHLQWFFAEGATGEFFDLFILIGNPSDEAAHVTATYLFDDGTTCSAPVGNATQGGALVLGPKSRHNIWVDLEVIPGCPRSLADAAVSTTITSDVPLVAERAMWWPGSTSTWAEAHNSAGATETGTRWGFADGEQGFEAASETYVLVANTSTFAGTAKVTLYFEDGTSVEKTVELLANSRTNIPIGVVYDGARVADGLAERSGFGFGTDSLDRRFGVVVESLPAPGQSGAAQIVVERSTYWNGPGAAFWAAGTNALATKLD